MNAVGPIATASYMIAVCIYIYIHTHTYIYIYIYIIFRVGQAAEERRQNAGRTQPERTLITQRDMSMDFKRISIDFNRFHTGT